MLLAPEISSAEALNDFRAQIDALTLQAVCGRPYIRVAKLREWLQSKHPETNQSQLQRLLYACIGSAQPQHLRPYIIPEQLKSTKSIVLLGTLCTIGRFQYLERLYQSPFFRKQLPADNASLIKELKAAGVPKVEVESFAREFYAAQWRFCPVVFCLRDDSQYRRDHVLPIVRRKIINSKSDTAELVQIEILEEFLDENLRKKVPHSRYDHGDDSLGARYQFALKTFRGEHLAHYFYREKDNFANLRDHEGMINCLNTFLHLEYGRPRRPSNHSEQSQDESSIFTYNFLLEYGDRDLDTYFVQVVPPFLEPEIVGFWKELLEVVKAVAAIHEYVNPDTGREDDRYKGFHADIKPENILLVEGKCKLADFGFTKFVQETDTEERAFLAGATWKYSAPEHLPGKTEKVTQSVDIWSLGCVFSIAATWIVGGYANVRDFTRVREKAIQNVKIERPNALRSLKGGDLFCDGTNVLDDVKAWHTALRVSVRQSDKITAQILNIVDKHMLLENPSERITCKQLHDMLSQVIRQTPIDPQHQLPQSILKALQEINDEAPHNPTPTSSSTSKQQTTDSTGTAPERIGKKRQIMDIPLRKTAYREEYLRSRSVLSDRPPATNDEEALPGARRPSGIDRDPNIPTSGALQQQRPARLTQYIQETRDPASAPHEPIDLFKVHHMIEVKRKGLFGFQTRPKPLKVDYVLKYCRGFDIKFLVDNGWTMKRYWDSAWFALQNLAMTASPLDDNGMDLTFTRGGSDVKNEKRGQVLAQSMYKRGNEPTNGVQTDMHEALNRIFNEYLRENMGRTNPKRLLLIVLTDGVWRPKTNMTLIQSAIVGFLKKVQTAFEFISRPVCIQFVQFGHDPAATDRLRFLDDHLCQEAGFLDVIDTEHFLGDVIKMFLGSHVPEYDALAPMFESLSPTHPSPGEERTIQSSSPSGT